MPLPEWWDRTRDMTREAEDFTHVESVAATLRKHFNRDEIDKVRRTLITKLELHYDGVAQRPREGYTDEHCATLLALASRYASQLTAEYIAQATSQYPRDSGSALMPVQAAALDMAAVDAVRDQFDPNIRSKKSLPNIPFTVARWPLPQEEPFIIQTAILPMLEMDSANFAVARASWCARLRLAVSVEVTINPQLQRIINLLDTLVQAIYAVATKRGNTLASVPPGLWWAVAHGLEDACAPLTARDRRADYWERIELQRRQCMVDPYGAVLSTRKRPRE